MKKIAVVFGTRPDTIKMAPIILELQKENKYFEVLTIATGQHRQMLDQVLDVFNIKPDYDLDIMKPKQTLASITKDTIEVLDGVFEKEKPDMVLVQGDTTTTFVGSLAAFYRQIPVGHVEAGLRTNDKANPFPEEINRRLTGCIADLHFPPTATAKKAILKENIKGDNVYITGNTVIDSLKIVVKKNYSFLRPELNELFRKKRKFVLITMHRRENWGEPMLGACNAVKKLAAEFPGMDFIFPVHLNPIVRDVVFPALGDIENIHLIEPLDYPDFVNLMSKAYLLITDSGGVQEEGPHFGIPVLVLRKVTERPEAVKYGTVKLVGLDENKIYSSAKKLICDREFYKKMSSAANPYGDGRAARRTVQIIKNYFKIGSGKISEFNI